MSSSFQDESSKTRGHLKPDLHTGGAQKKVHCLKAVLAMRSLLRDLKSNPRRHVQNVLLKYEPHFKFIKVVMQKQDQPREPSYVIDA